MISNILRNSLPLAKVFFFFTSLPKARRLASFAPKHPSRLPSLCPRPLLCGLVFSECSYSSFACPFPSFFYIPFPVCLFSSPIHPITTGETGPHTISACPFNFTHFSKYLNHPTDPIILLCDLVLPPVCHLYGNNNAECFFPSFAIPFSRTDLFKFLFRLPRARRPLFSISHAQFIPIMRRIQPLTNARTLSQPKAHAT